MEIKATGLPETIEDYQVALNAAFAGGKAYGLAQRTWVGLSEKEMYKLWLTVDEETDRMAFGKAVEAKLKEKNND